MPGIHSAADAGAVPFDPFELKDMVSGSIRDPYPRLHELCRESPVHTGPIDLGEGADIGDPTKPPPVTVFGFDEVVQVLRDNETYSNAVYGRRGGDGHGPHHPPDGRARAPEGPRPRRIELPLQDARTVGGGARGRRGQRAHRLVRRARPVGPGAGGDVQLPGAGDRAHPRATTDRLPTVPALGARAHERRGQLGARHRGLGGAARLLRRHHGGATCCAGRRSHQRPGAGRGRRGAPQRRGDLLLLASAAAGRGRDDLPRLGQSAARAAQRPGPARGPLPRPLAVRPGLRGGAALGAAGDADPAAGHV